MKNLVKSVLILSLFGIFAVPAFNVNPVQAEQTEFRSVRASHILVDTEEEALELKKRIENGESFEKLAKEYSKCMSREKGGNLGFFKRGQMVKPFEDAAFSLPIGVVSDPVKTEYGWHLIKVTSKI